MLKLGGALYVDFFPEIFIYHAGDGVCMKVIKAVMPKI
jgi:hypothetical protein